MHTPQPTRLTLIGPFKPSEGALKALDAQKRLCETTLAPLRQAGFDKWAWINPKEQPGGCPLLADGVDIVNNGAFVYTLAGGSLAVLCTRRQQARWNKRRPRCCCCTRALQLLQLLHPRGCSELRRSMLARLLRSAVIDAALSCGDRCCSELR